MDSIWTNLKNGTTPIGSSAGEPAVPVNGHRPLYHVEISAPAEIAVSARPEFWRRFDHSPFNVGGYVSGGASPPGAEPPQDVRLQRGGRILWYFPVGDRSIYPDDLKAYEVEHMASGFADPFRFNTFGNLLECPSLTLQDGALAGRGRTFDIRIHALAMQTPKDGRRCATRRMANCTRFFRSAVLASPWEAATSWPGR